MHPRKLVAIGTTVIFVSVFAIFSMIDSRGIAANDLSAWLWESPDTFKEPDLRKMFQLAKDENISTIYLRVDDYADIYEMRDEAQKALRLKKFNDASRQFIILAGEYGIRVQALGGNTNWAESDQLFYPNYLFDAVLDYNKSNPVKARFVGIQFDVEAHNSNAYKKDKILVLAKYLDFIQEMVERKEKDKMTASSNFYIGFAIPFWYDNQNNNGVILNWRNFGSKPVAYHLFDILNEVTGGYVVLMDYRNYALGTDGAIKNAINEIEYASENSSRVKIIIGQETTNVSPSKITFYGTSKEYFKEETSKIIEGFSGYRAFAGIAIHHLPSYIDL